jgi:hypothetical protein
MLILPPAFVTNEELSGTIDGQFADFPFLILESKWRDFVRLLRPADIEKLSLTLSKSTPDLGKGAELSLRLAGCKALFRRNFYK